MSNGDGKRIRVIDFDDRDIALFSLAIICLACIWKDPNLARLVVPTGITAIGAIAKGRKKGDEK